MTNLQEEYDIEHDNCLVEEIKCEVEGTNQDKYLLVTLTLGQIRVLKARLLLLESTLQRRRFLGSIFNVADVSNENQMASIDKIIQQKKDLLELDSVVSITNKILEKPEPVLDSVYTVYNDVTCHINSVVVGFDELSRITGSKKELINKKLARLHTSFGPAVGKLAESVKDWIDNKQSVLIKHANEHKSLLVDEANFALKFVYGKAMKGLEKLSGYGMDMIQSAEETVNGFLGLDAAMDNQLFSCLCDSMRTDCWRVRERV